MYENTPSEDTVRIRADRPIPKKKLYDYLIKVDGKVCNLCGKSTAIEIAQYQRWRRLGRFSGYKRTKINLDIDHKIPYSVVGGDKWGDLENLQLVHKTCNARKGNRNGIMVIPNKEDFKA